MSRIRKTLLVVLSSIFATGTMQAQIVTNVANFDGTNGGNPRAMSLAQGLDGNLYGTTWEGGSNAKGVVFKLSGGTITALHTFSGVAPDGSFPSAGLVLGTNGKFYGTTELGGAFGGGIVFSMASSGVFKTLHSFNGADGFDAEGALVQSTMGPFFGTTEGGGTAGGGTVFKISPAGSFTSLYNFGTKSGDGFFSFAGLAQGLDGKFYGTTVAGGGNACNCGAVFNVTAGGTEKVLHGFGSGGNFFDGAQPISGLVRGLDGNFYGTAQGGGFQFGGNGTVFKITPAGVLTPLHAFAGYPGDGSLPYAGLTLGSDGNLYGTTFQGGSQTAACNCGTVFQIAPDGTYRLLYSFTNGTDGRNPYGGLFQATDGLFYGTAIAGGPNTNASCFYDSTQTCGTIFAVFVGLHPFVIDLPAAAKVGKTVKILGNNLSGTSAVAFNGTPASFTVVSGTQIKTSVPVGATTGSVTVTTPSGTLTSNVPFRVLP